VDIEEILVILLVVSGCLALAGLAGAVVRLARADATMSTQVSGRFRQRGKRFSLRPLFRAATGGQGIGPIAQEESKTKTGGGRQLPSLPTPGQSESTSRSARRSASVEGRTHFGDFFVFMGGGEPELLEYVPSERGRYLQLGGIVLTSACLGALSIFFALRNNLQTNLLPAIVLGIFWGLITLNIDRFLVGSGISDPHNRLWNVLAALPRVLIAGLFAFINSIPIILRIFAEDIHRQMLSTPPGHTGTGILEELQALSRITARSPTTLAAEWAVWSFFVILAVFPLIVNLTMTFAPATEYQQLVADRDRERVRSVIRQRDESRLIEEGRAEVRLSVEADMRRREAEIGIHANQYVTDAMREVLDLQLSGWRNRMEQVGSDMPETAIEPAALRSFAREALELIEAVRVGDLAKFS
jgi:hypothetical protein